MKKLQLLCIPLLLALATACSAGVSEEEATAGSADAEASQSADKGSDKGDAMPMDETTSYAIGWQTGQSFAQQNVVVVEESLIQGLRDAIAGSDAQFTDEEMMGAIQKLQQDMMARSRAQAQEKSAANSQEATEFFAANGAREGVMTTASGLQYEVITEGEGPKPAVTDTVSVHYRGTLLDGTEFDSSIARGQPATFPLNRVISGWTEGLQLMSVGSKYKLFIPSDLGYGDQGSGPQIGPGAALIFEVELLEIKQ